MVVLGDNVNVFGCGGCVGGWVNRWGDLFLVAFVSYVNIYIRWRVGRRDHRSGVGDTREDVTWSLFFYGDA